MLRRTQLERFGVILFLQIVDKIAVANEISDWLPRIMGEVETELALGGGIAPLDLVAAVQQHYAVRQGAGGMTETVERGAELRLAATVAALVMVQCGEYIFPDSCARRHARQVRFPEPQQQFVQPVQMTCQVGKYANSENSECGGGIGNCPQEQTDNDQREAEPHGSPADILHAVSYLISVPIMSYCAEKR